MRVPCDNCGATYNIPEEKIKGRPFRFKCKKCGETVRVRPDAPAEGGKKTMEIAAADVQPRMTGQMAAAKPQAPADPGREEMAKTAFTPTKEATVKKAPAPTAPAEKKPRLTLDGKPLPQQPVAQAAAWYLAYSKNKRGPMTVDEIRKHLIENKIFQGDIYIWKAGFQNWMKIQDVPEFKGVVEALAQAASAPAAPAVSSQPSKVQPKETESQKDTMVQAERPSFTDLLRNELGGKDEKKGGKRKDTQKIDISQLVSQETMGHEEEAAKPEDLIEKSSQKKVQPAGRKLKGQAALKEYVPPKKKKIAVIPILILLSLFLLVIGTPLTLAYLRIIEIPGLDEAPLIGPYFKKEQVDRYAQLREQWEMLVKIEEASVALQSTKEEEEKQRIEEELKKAQEEKKARMERARQRRARYTSSGGGGGSAAQNVVEMDFSMGSDGTEMETEGEMNTIDRKRNQPLSQAEVNKVVRKNMRGIARCVNTQKKKYGAISGQMNVRFTVSRRGTVVRASVQDAKFQNSYVGDCVCETLERIKFPKSGGAVTISYPFTIR